MVLPSHPIHCSLAPTLALVRRVGRQLRAEKAEELLSLRAISGPFFFLILMQILSMPAYLSVLNFCDFFKKVCLADKNLLSFF